MRLARQINWDAIGAASSLLCAVHCVLTGMAFGLISALGATFLANPTTEFAFFSLTLLAGLFAIYQGLRKHRQWWPSAFFAIGFACLVCRHLFFHQSHVHHHGETHAEPVQGVILSVIGATLLVTFHVINSVKMHRAGKCDHAVVGVHSSTAAESRDSASSI